MKKTYSQHRIPKTVLLVFSILAISASRFIFMHNFSVPVSNLIPPMSNNDDVPVCETMQELVDCIEESLISKNKILNVKLGEELDPDSIININQYVNPCWGSCTRYSEITDLGFDTMTKVELSLEITDEVYVYDAILNHSDISQAPVTAQKLYNRVRKILDTKINPSMSEYKKELTFYKYLLDTCEYNRGHVKVCHCSTIGSKEVSESVDPSHTAYGALVEGCPVCSGYARAMNLLLACEGIKTKIISGTGKREDHCWNLVQLDDKWYQLDVTWDDNGVSDKSSFYYFNITDDMMSGSHTWDRNMYPAATGKKYNYYRMNRRYFTNRKKFKKKLHHALVDEGKKSYTAMLDGFHVKEKDLDVLFQGDGNFSSIRWNMFEDNTSYTVIKVITG